MVICLIAKCLKDVSSLAHNAYFHCYSTQECLTILCNLIYEKERKGRRIPLNVKTRNLLLFSLLLHILTVSDDVYYIYSWLFREYIVFMYTYEWMAIWIIIISSYPFFIHSTPFDIIYHLSILQSIKSILLKFNFSSTKWTQVKDSVLEDGYEHFSHILYALWTRLTVQWICS